MKSLQLRFLVAMLLGATAFALIAASIAYKLAFSRAIAEGQSTLSGLISAVENTAAIAAYTGDQVLLQEVVDGLSRNELSAHVEIRSAHDTVLALKSVYGISEEEVSPDRMTVYVRLNSPFDKSEAVGTLSIRPNMAKLQGDAGTAAGTLAALIVAQTVAVAFLLYLVAARFVSRPIIKLANTLRVLKPGGAQQLKMPAVHANDEIGTLITSANTLLSANHVALLRERELRAEIEKMEAQYRQIFDASSAGIFVLTPHGQLINSNPTAMEIVGLAMDEVRKMTGEELLEHVFVRPDKVREMVDSSARSGETVSSDLELKPHTGHPRWVHCLLSVQKADKADTSSPIHGLIEGVMYDVTERKKAESEVQHLALHDPLTGVKNRAGSDALLDQFLSLARATHSPVCVMYIDLDGFKRVNDQLGHKAGDQVLIQCAERLRYAVLRGSDLIGRVGGDEFLVALNQVGTDDELVGIVAQSIVNYLCEPITLDDGQVAQIGASVGIACYPKHGISRKALLSAADSAMYEVKRTGKNSFAMAVDAVAGS